MSNNPKPESEEALTRALRGWVVDAPLPPRFSEQVWRRISRLEPEAGPSVWATLVRPIAEAFRRPKLAYAFVGVLLALGATGGHWTAQEESNRLGSTLGTRYVGSVDPYQLASWNK